MTEVRAFQTDTYCSVLFYPLLQLKPRGKTAQPSTHTTIKRPESFFAFEALLLFMYVDLIYYPCVRSCVFS